MAKFVKLGALVEKHLGADAFETIYQFKGVEYAFMETGRSNDLFEDRQFGQFGEAAILTLIVENKLKDAILQELSAHLGVSKSQSGLVYQEQSVHKFKTFFSE